MRHHIFQLAKKDATRGVLFYWLCSGVPKTVRPFPPEGRSFLLIPKSSRSPLRPLAALLPCDRGTDARREPAGIGRAVTDPNKSFWEGWGELEGGRGDLFSKRAPFPPQKNDHRLAQVGDALGLAEGTGQAGVVGELHGHAGQQGLVQTLL